ncbi:MAG TPA: Pr6Pr family membrane protein [Candidatus Limnocylindrales bacterium]|jgi:hypothetical protein
MDLRPLLRVVRIVSIVVVLAAIVVQAKTLADAGKFDVTRFFAFFTIQSNLIGVAALAWVLANGDRPRSRNLELFRGAAAGYLSVTFLVVIFLLSGVDVQLQLVWVDIALHKIFPIIVVLDWILEPPQTRLAIRDAGIWLVYPIAWTVLTIIRGAIDGWYPYPFLDPANGGYGKVAVTVVAVTIGFVVISVAFIWLGNWRRDASSAPLRRT